MFYAYMLQVGSSAVYSGVRRKFFTKFILRREENVYLEYKPIAALLFFSHRIKTGTVTELIKLVFVFVTEQCKKRRRKTPENVFLLLPVRK